MDENYLKEYVEYVKDKRAEEDNDISNLSETSDDDYLKCLNDMGFLYGTIIWK